MRTTTQSSIPQKIAAMLLTAVLLLGFMPPTAFAADDHADLTAIDGKSVSPVGTGTLASPKTGSITIASNASALSTIATVSANATAVFYDSTFTTITPTAIDPPQGGSATAYIIVTAEDGTTQVYYAITVNRRTAEEDLITALKGTTADTITITTNITLATWVDIGANHTLTVDSGVTLTMSGSGGIGVGTTQTLTVNGGGTVTVAKAAGGNGFLGAGGTLNLENITVNLQNTGGSYGIQVKTVNVNSGAVININSTAGSSFIRLDNGYALNVNSGGKIDIQNLSASGDGIAINGSTGVLNVASGGTVTVGGSAGSIGIFNGGTINNNGTLTIGTSGMIENRGTITNSGSITNNGLINNIYGDSTITGAGTVGGSNGAPPVVTAHPQDVSVTDGGNVSFSVTATGATSYQWWGYDYDGYSITVTGGIYNGAATATLSLTGVTIAANNGDWYGCIVTGAGGTTNSAGAELTVGAAVTGVSLNKVTASITAGATETLTATVLPANAANKSVTWSTSDASVATVSTGVVTAVSAGTATITATTVDGGFTATCAVTVTAAQGNPNPGGGGTTDPTPTPTPDPEPDDTLNLDKAEELLKDGKIYTAEFDCATIALGPDALEILAALGLDGTTPVTIEVAPVPMKDLTGMQAAQVKGCETVISIDIFVGDEKVDVPITVSIPYTLKENENPAAVCVWYMDDAGNLTKLNGVYKDGYITFTIDHQSYFVVGYDPVALWVNIFSDVSESDPYYYAIAYANYYGLLNGYGNGLSGANDTLSRAQMVTLLWNLEGKPAPNGAGRFTDVANGAWYHDPVQWAAESGIVAGVGGGLFDPERAVSLQEMAVMLLHYAKFKGYDIPDNRDMPDFSDSGQISVWAESAAKALSEAGVMGNGGAFNPHGAATRADAADALMYFLRFVADELPAPNKTASAGGADNNTLLAMLPGKEAVLEEENTDENNICR